MFISILWTGTNFAETINGIVYSLNATTRTATVVQDSYYSGAIVIPEQVNYNNRDYTVTGIGPKAFQQRSITSVVIPSTVTSIGSYAFHKCTLLNSVTISEGCEIIDAFAFYGCSSLAKINIPSSVKRIEEQAFADCSMLAEVTLNDGLTYIGAWAFGALQKLKSITIPSTVEDMGFQSFYNCKNLAKIIWNAKHCSDFVSVLASPFSIYNFSLPDMKWYDANVYLYTTSSDKEGYRYRIDNPYYTYREFYYSGSSSSKYYIINSDPNRNIAINNWTTQITFGDEVEHIPAYLCYKFQGELRNLVIPDNVKTIGDYAFYENNRLVSLKLGAGLTEIGKNAFCGCSSLTELTIPDNVTTINQYAFSGCYSLTTLTFGKGIQTLGTYAFGYGGNLTTINIYAVNPPFIDNTVFTDYSDLMSIDLNVREKAMDAYSAANIWKNMHLGIVANDPREFSLTVLSADNTQGTTTPSGSYDEDDEVVISALPKAGYQFDHWNDGSKDNPRTVKVTADLTYTAYFAAVAPTYTITATANAIEGTAVGGGAFESGKQTTLVAVANTGYHFTQWSDGNKDNPRMVTVAADASFVAQFEKDAVVQKYTLTTTSTNASQGTAYGQGTYEADMQVAIFAVANDGYHFTQWHDGNTDNPRMVTVKADAMYFANFAQDPVAPTLYELNVSPEVAAEGWTTEGCAYELGAQVMIYAQPAEGYVFSRWSDGNVDNPRFITVTAAVDLTAHFAVKTSTGVGAVVADIDDPQVRKIMLDGHVYILRGDRLYSLQGQKIQ
ncbi:MAG: leucine-rich repeat domain-containing protein [Paludibacteraceae bacterium]|nr:leucine-rich repeat domain-containing protein [Paludibacteraceae bacterium]